MSPDILATLLACWAGVLIAYIESRRSPVDDHVREQLDEMRERQIRLEQKYMAYPAAREVLDRLSALDASVIALESKLGDE